MPQHGEPRGATRTPMSAAPDATAAAMAMCTMSHTAPAPAADAAATAVAAGKALRFALPDGSEEALPLDVADSIGVYAALCTTLDVEDLDPSASSLPLPQFVDAASARVVCARLEAEWRRTQPGFRDQRAAIAKLLTQMRPDLSTIEDRKDVDRSGRTIEDGAITLVQSYVDAQCYRVLQGADAAAHSPVCGCLSRSDAGRSDAGRWRAAVQACLPDDLAAHADVEGTTARLGPAASKRDWGGRIDPSYQCGGRKGQHVAMGRKGPPAYAHKELVFSVEVTRQDRPTLDAEAALYLTAVLEYLATEVLDLAAGSASKGVICEADVVQAIRGDEELTQLPCSVAVAMCWPGVHSSATTRGEDVTLLCSTLKLADYLGFDDLQAELAQALADACTGACAVRWRSLDGGVQRDAIETIGAVLGNPKSAPAIRQNNEDLVARIASLCPVETASAQSFVSGSFVSGEPVRRAFVLAAQTGPAACLDDSLVATVAALILTPFERKLKEAKAAEDARAAAAKAALAEFAATSPAAKALVAAQKAFEAAQAALDGSELPCSEPQHDPALWLACSGASWLLAAGDEISYKFLIEAKETWLCGTVESRDGSWVTALFSDGEQAQVLCTSKNHGSSWCRAGAAAAVPAPAPALDPVQLGQLFATRFGERLNDPPEGYVGGQGGAEDGPLQSLLHGRQSGAGSQALGATARLGPES